MIKLPTVIILTAATSIQGFGLLTTVPARVQTSSPAFSRPIISGDRRFTLNAVEGEQTEGDEKVEEVKAELTDDEPSTPASDEEAEADEEEEEEEEKEPEEDPEITAIKSEIAQLESDLKLKNRELNDLERMADEYTKAGYARKVAEMESLRRTRNAASTDTKMAARATALQSFLPTLDKLKEITAQYEGDAFAKGYSALSWDFNNALQDLGVSEFSVKEGDSVDTRRVAAVREEHSDTIAKGCVIEPQEIGYELEGNVMRLAGAVVSLGPEAVEEESEEDAEEEVSEETASEE